MALAGKQAYIWENNIESDPKWAVCFLYQKLLGVKAEDSENREERMMFILVMHKINVIKPQLLAKNDPLHHTFPAPDPVLLYVVQPEISTTLNLDFLRTRVVF